MLYVVSYDIADDARRVRVHATLRNYGTRVQYSVFECDLEPGQVEELRGGWRASSTPTKTTCATIGSARTASRRPWWSEGGH
jgi:CRISPR-associated endonuclease Cas2